MLSTEKGSPATIGISSSRVPAAMPRSGISGPPILQDPAVIRYQNRAGEDSRSPAAKQFNVYMLNHHGPPEADPATTEILDRIIRILNRAARIEAEPIDIGHGILLHASEVHLIDMAGRYPGENVTRIAARLGVTKGAVSQLARRLEEKGYLQRLNREGDQKTVLLCLTERGREAFEWHRSYHARVNQSIAREIARLPAGEAESLGRVLEQIEAVLEKSPRVRQEHTREFAEALRRR